MKKANVIATGICASVASAAWIYNGYKWWFGGWSFSWLIPPMVTAYVFTLLSIVGWVLLNMSMWRGDGETRCRKCKYILRGLSEPRCSECGERI